MRAGFAPRPREVIIAHTEGPSMDERVRAERARVIGALLAVQVFFGLHYLAAKLVLAEIPPLTWATLRVGAAALLMAPLPFLLGRKVPSRPRDLAGIAACALFGVVINQVCFIEGLARTTVTHSSIINTTIPVGTLAFAVLLGRERLTGGKVVALGLALAGVLLVLRPWQPAAGTPTLAGDLLTLTNSLSYAFFLVISKRVLHGNDALASTSLLLAFGAAGIFTLGAPGLSRFDPVTVSARTWALAAFVVVFATVGAYLLNFWALARADSSVVALFVYLQPLIASTLSFVALGERPPLAVLAGGGLIFAGVFFALRR